MEAYLGWIVSAYVVGAVFVYAIVAALIHCRRPDLPEDDAAVLGERPMRLPARRGPSRPAKR